MSVCAALWRAHEETQLQQSVERLLAYAQEQEGRSPIYQGERGYIASIRAAQDTWLDWRNNECTLMTLSSVGGSIRGISLPMCQARLTTLRRERLDELLALWQAEFRDTEGRIREASCVLEPELDHCRREP
jgi:uncharacterized protein YecT (DUF1311 family)